MDYEEMKGTYSALMTPYTKDNRIDVEMIGRLVEHQLANGLRGFFVGGSTGEGMLLSYAERTMLLETVIRVNRGRGKVIAHVGHVSTDESVRLARHAADAGADWVSSTAPVYFAQTFDGALYHYRRIAEASDLPFMVYAFFTTVDPVRDLRLFEIKNLRGMKYTNIDYYSVQQLQERLDKSALFLSGVDEMTVPALASGCFQGCIGMMCNMLPRQFTEICRLMLDENDPTAARPIQNEANAVIALKHGYGGLPCAKEMMRYIGLDCGPCRGPFPPLSEEQAAHLSRLFRAQGILKAV